MIRFRRFFPIVALMVGAAILGAPAAARAGFSLRLHETGFADVVINDNGSGDSSPATGVITFAGSFGDFAVQVTTGSSNSSTNTLPAMLTINSLSISASAPGAPLVLTLEDTGFNVPAPGTASLQSQLSNTQSPVGGTTITFQSFLNAQGGSIITETTTSGNVGASDSVTIGATPYTLKNVTTIAMTSAGTVQTTGQTEVPNSVATPAPPALLLGLTGLPFLGFGCWLRRRKSV